MLERTIIQIKDAVRRASERIIEGEELVQLLEDAGEDTTEVRTALIAARSRRDQWVSALRVRGHMSAHEEE